MKFCVIIILTLLIQLPKEKDYQDFCPIHSGGGMGGDALVFLYTS